MSAAALRILYGPTASGKSSLALGAQSPIINADALQIYNALPILTAQPTAEEQAQTPHFLYGFADPKSPMNAAQYATLAAQKIGETAAPVLVGGTGMYITTLLDGIAPIPVVAPDVRSAVTRHYDALGPEQFHARLQKIDPTSAAKTHPNRREQMIRAMEVYEATGESLSDWHAKPRQAFLPEYVSTKLIVFLPDKAWIVERAATRLDQMIAAGVLEEVQTFGLNNGTDAPVCKALGFHALWAHVNGKLPLEQAREIVQRNTADYIKRQLTWGRNQLAARDGAITCRTPDDVQIALGTYSG